MYDNKHYINLHKIIPAELEIICFKLGLQDKWNHGPLSPCLERYHIILELNLPWII